ncbi:glycosyltransferase family 2 protein [Thermotalea metallivorans]|uniref:N-acetylglucosaminyl-diphospho-decaprenol L-rhamnosyltransferase n=1 Tax=Thermotalea metallivorans TaxID=520762 RepID=A0A140L6W5_9FIRM|nr:glycosyltransferase family 2 protein [Thermotalea metallivorans]KXG76290.1 N-acetylglucosaminyl-diphospho-decaprenol L-rhamnosyltransferase [Thermotalea metallivorans]
MKVSIIIPNYNGGKYLKVCLDALRRQTFKDFETIIVDNASTDSSYKIISDYYYPNFQLIKLDKNYGFSKAVNEGIKIAKGEYVVLLNNDTEVKEDWLYHLIQCIKEDDRIFSCSSKMIQYYDRIKIDDAGDAYTILGWAYKRGDGQSIEKYDKNEEVFSSCAGAAIYRRKIFNQIGDFDEQFFAYMEDVDIGYRARIYGYRNVYCPDAIVYHIGSGTSKGKYNEFKIELAARNNVYVPYKNMPLVQLLFNLPFLCIGFLIKYMFFVKKGYGRVYLNGLCEGLKSLKKIRRVKYERKHFWNYIKIEGMLFMNTLRYVRSKLWGFVRW